MTITDRPQDIDYLTRIMADPHASTVHRWVRRYWATVPRRERLFIPPFCVRLMRFRLATTFGASGGGAA